MCEQRLRVGDRADLSVPARVIALPGTAQVLLDGAADESDRVGVRADDLPHGSVVLVVVLMEPHQRVGAMGVLPDVGVAVALRGRVDAELYELIEDRIRISRLDARLELLEPRDDLGQAGQLVRVVDVGQEGEVVLVWVDGAHETSVPQSRGDVDLRRGSVKVLQPLACRCIPALVLDVLRLRQDAPLRRRSHTRRELLAREAVLELAQVFLELRLACLERAQHRRLNHDDAPFLC